MLAILTLCWGNLRRKKMQNALIALLIALSTLLISTAVAVIMNSQDIFAKRHMAAFGAHEIINLTEGLHDQGKVADWWAQQEGVHSSRLLPYKPWTGLAYNGDELTNLYLYMMSTPDMPLGVDNLLPAQGPATLDAPETGTVWVPTSLAYKYDMAVGDELMFAAGSEPVSYKISAVVIDLSHGGPFSTTARIWMNEEDYESLSPRIAGSEKYMLALRYDQLEQSSSYWQSFETDLGSPFLESRTSYNELFSFYFILNKVIGFVMCFLGAVMIVIALFTIGFTITDTILASYRTIGITKSLGMLSSQIIGVYLLQYSLLAIAAIAPALVGGKLLSDLVVQSSLSLLKTDYAPVTANTAAIFWGVGAALLLIIVLCAWRYAWKARQVEPIQGIRYGMSEQSHSRTHRASTSSKWLEHLSVPALIGWKQISSNKKGSILIFLLATITTAVLVFGTSLVTSIYNISQTAPQWGYDNNDISIIVINNSEPLIQEIEQAVQSNEAVRSINWTGSATGVIPHTYTVDGQTFSLPLTVVDGSMDELGLASLEGRNPQLYNEISIGVNIARQLQKEVGDTINIFIEGKQHQLLVTGIFQSISNMSNTARISRELVQQFVLDSGFIELSEGADADRLVQDLSSRFAPDVQVVTQQTLLDSVFKEAAGVLLIPMLMMAILFSAITCLIVYSNCRLGLRKDIKTYGIYASLGLTIASIRRALTIGTASIAVIGALTGVVCGIYVLPAMLRGLLSNYGIEKLPLIVEPAYLFVIALCVPLITAIGCWLASTILQRISLRMLIAE